MHESRSGKRSSVAQRKAALIAQGAALRAEITRSKETVRAGARPDALAKGVLHQAMNAATGAFMQRNGAGIGGLDLPAILPTILPLLFSAASALSRRRALWKPALVAVLAAGAAAAGAAWLRRKKAAHGDSPAGADASEAAAE